MDAQPNSKSDERKAELEQVTTQTLERLAEALAAGHTEEFQEILAFYARFWRYSYRNVLLIKQQLPTARRVAAYTLWKKLGFQVDKGQQALWIFAPLLVKVPDPDTGEKTEKLIGFKPVPVFDVSQLTEESQERLPNLYQLLPDDCREEVERVIATIKGTGLAVGFAKLAPGIQGMAVSTGITIREGMDSRNTLATLLHEWAHALTHFTEDAKGKPTQQVELEAESCAFVMMAHFGLPHTFAADYLLSYRITVDELKASFGVIQAIVRRMLKLLESKEETTDTTGSLTLPSPYGRAHQRLLLCLLVRVTHDCASIWGSIPRSL